MLGVQLALAVFVKLDSDVVLELFVADFVVVVRVNLQANI